MNARNKADELAALACRLGEKHIPVFVFHEAGVRRLVGAGNLRSDSGAERRRLLPLRCGSGEALRELLSTVAAYSAAGLEGVKRVGLPVTIEGQQLRARLLLPAGK